MDNLWTHIVAIYSITVTVYIYIYIYKGLPCIIDLERLDPWSSTCDVRPKPELTVCASHTAKELGWTSQSGFKTNGRVAARMSWLIVSEIATSTRIPFWTYWSHLGKLLGKPSICNKWFRLYMYINKRYWIYTTSGDSHTEMVSDN